MDNGKFKIELTEAEILEIIKKDKTLQEQILKTIEVLGIGNVLEVSCDETGAEILHVEIDSIELPQYPIVSVKKIEPVWIYVQDEKIPIVYCRDDFPVVPHLNVYDDGKKAFAIACKIDPKLKFRIGWMKVFLKIESSILNLAKRVYFSLKT